MATTIQLIRKVTSLGIEIKKLQRTLRHQKEKLYKVKSYLNFCINHQDESDKIRRQLVILWKEEFEEESQENGVLAYIDEEKSKPLDLFITEDGKIKVTPCCKSRHWHLVNKSDIPRGVIRCELCDRMHDYENLEIIDSEVKNE